MSERGFCCLDTVQCISRHVYTSFRMSDLTLSHYLCFCLFLRPQHAQEDFEEETMEDDEAELTLNKVEEEMMVFKILITLYLNMPLKV